MVMVVVMVSQRAAGTEPLGRFVPERTDEDVDGEQHNVGKVDPAP